MSLSMLMKQARHMLCGPNLCEWNCKFFSLGKYFKFELWYELFLRISSFVRQTHTRIGMQWSYSSVSIEVRKWIPLFRKFLHMNRTSQFFDVIVWNIEEEMCSKLWRSSWQSLWKYLISNSKLISLQKKLYYSIYQNMRILLR